MTLTIAFADVYIISSTPVAGQDSMYLYTSHPRATARRWAHILSTPDPSPDDYLVPQSYQPITLSSNDLSLLITQLRSHAALFGVDLIDPIILPPGPPSPTSG